MSADRPPKRKPVDKQGSVSPETPAKKKRPKSPTAADLEALLRLIDESEHSDPAVAAARKPRKTTSGRAPKPAPEKPSPPGEGPSFIEELALARADLHKERRSRIALEEEVESLRRELTRLAAHDSSKVDELHREFAGLRKQLVAIERQRQKLKDALLNSESELDAEQRQRERLNDLVDAIKQRLVAECSRREAIEADLEATRQEHERRTIEAEAARSSWNSVLDELQAELASMASRCEQAVQERDASQSAVLQQQSEVAALSERLADAETKVREQDESIQQAGIQAENLARSAIEWEERFHNEQATRVRVEQQVSEQVNEHDIETSALDSRVAASQREVATLREQLASANSELEAAKSARTQLEQLVQTTQHNHEKAVAKNREVAEAAETIRNELTSQIHSLEGQLAGANKGFAESAADEQLLRAELTDARNEKHKTAVSLHEMTDKNERLKERVGELETKLAASNQLVVKGQVDLEVVNDRIERIQADVARGRMDLAESFEQLGGARLRLANADRDQELAQQREAEALHRADELADEVKSLQASVQREAAARRKAEAMHKREAGEDVASALFEAEQRIERLSRELASSKGVEAAYQQKATRKVQQVKQELEALQQRLAEIEQRPESS